MKLKMYRVAEGTSLIYEWIAWEGSLPGRE